MNDYPYWGLAGACDRELNGSGCEPVERPQRCCGHMRNGTLLTCPEQRGNELLLPRLGNRDIAVDTAVHASDPTGPNLSVESIIRHPKCGRLATLEYTELPGLQGREFEPSLIS